MKAHELARELGISQKELVNFLQQRRLTRNAAAPLAPGAIEAARSAFKPASVAVKIAPNGDRRVVLPPSLSVKDLAEKLSVSPVEVIKKLMASNIMATINQVIDFATAEIVADEFGYTVEPVSSEDVVSVESPEGEAVVTTSREELFSLANEDPTKLKPRPPIVTELGHVDHGKTSILDDTRQTRGACTDRPASVAQVTDLVGLGGPADAGGMPQTVEAIHHARAARVPIIVAINKMDKEGANPDRVHQELATNGIVTRHYGGEHECVHLSAKTGQGIDDLLTTIVLSTDILELKANPDRNAIGTIVDAHLERGRGPVATVLVQAGTLKVGDDFVCGHIYSRVRALADDRGQPVSAAPPATPVVVSGMSEVPQAGDIFQVVGSEKVARQIALTKLSEKRTQEAARDFAPRITLEELARRAKEGEVKELSLVVKADAQGTLEAVLSALQKIEDPVVAIKIVGQGVGAVSDSDLLLAGVSNAIIVCFNLKATPAAAAAAERAKVEVRYYDVIYKLTEDVERAAKGLREPTYRQIREGRVEVITPIKIPRLGIIAGSRVVEGKVSRGGWVKLFRGKDQIFEGRINSLKHFKEDVREMQAGQECGIGLEGFEAFEPGDVMETYRLEREEI